MLSNKILKEEFYKILKKWNKKDYLIFFLVIPFILISIYKLPSSIKQSYFILYSQDPSITSMFLSNYNNVFTQLLGNLALYLIVISLIFFIETDKKLFYKTSFSIFFILPFLVSVLTIYLLPHAISRGFSAIVSAFIGYLVYEAYQFVKVNLNSRKFAVFISFILAIISLTIIIPSDINFLKGKINIYAHYFGWWFGLVVPLLIQLYEGRG